MKLPTINLVRVASGVFSVAFIALAGYGAYQYYFNKPTPVINNHYIAMPNSNQTITQPKDVTQQRRLFTGLYGKKNEVGAIVGWMW